ncbi:DNA topoisomerase IA [Virgibacillus halotolerans]|nr:DNA topoisomerase IA [Virgibacillus halotolerans]
MLRLIITDKPSFAKNIADALKNKNRNDVYFEGNGYIITWAFGHLLQLYAVKDYDEKMAIWDLENFPYIPSGFRHKVKSDLQNRDKEDSRTKKQLKDDFAGVTLGATLSPVSNSFTLYKSQDTSRIQPSP